MAAPDLFSDSERERIRQSIMLAEKETSGEIRVYIEDKCEDDVLDRAAHVFETLEMHKTKSRNGVLIYLAIDHRKFAIIGDQGINTKTGPDFWKMTKEEMQAFFREGRMTDGLVHGIEQAGHKLKAYFPHQKGDTNELPDDIIFGKG